MLPSAPPLDETGEITPTWPLRTHLDLLPQPSSVPYARRYAALITAEWSLPALADSIRLVVSELTTNALEHAAADVPIHLWMLSDGARVVVLVGDSSPGPPLRIAEDTDAPGGRGLAIVEDLTGGSWGWFTREAGKVVWAIVQVA
jgi:anti-sigma regulatory factor (Ser/Thr protein kinase)